MLRQCFATIYSQNITILYSHFSHIPSQSFESMISSLLTEENHERLKKILKKTSSSAKGKSAKKSLIGEETLSKEDLFLLGEIKASFLGL